MVESNCLKAARLSGLDKQQLKRLIEIAREASNIGGDILMKHYGNLQNVRNKGRVGDLVTDADLECEKAVVKYLKKESPEIAILAEVTYYELK